MKKKCGCSFTCMLLIRSSVQSFLRQHLILWIKSLLLPARFNVIYVFTSCCFKFSCFSELNELGNEYGGQPDGDEVRAPIPVKREVLYDNAVTYG